MDQAHTAKEYQGGQRVQARNGMSLGIPLVPLEVACAELYAQNY
jgi:hypothetical protein